MGCFKGHREAYRIDGLRQDRPVRFKNEGELELNPAIAGIPGRKTRPEPGRFRTSVDRSRSRTSLGFRGMSAFFSAEMGDFDQTFLDSQP